MAQGKKSFIIYTDSRGMVNKLSNERAGILFKTLFSYCDDENPICDDEVIDMAFEHFKNILKRDLKKYENIVERNRNNGKNGGRPKNPVGNLETEINPKEPKKADSDNDNDIIDINNKLLSEIEISDVEDNLKKYFEIAKNFQELFIQNLTEKSISAVTQKNAKFKNYVTPIRLMIENNECTLQDLRDVWSYLSSPKSEFWKKNILSTTKLREQIVKLIFETKKL
jgi:transposase-like protein